MHQLQELVRLYRLGCTVRERTRLLKMSSRTEGRYRGILADAGLLDGSPSDIPELEILRSVVLAVVPVPSAPAVESSVDPWMEEIRKGLERGAGPTAIWDRLKRVDPEFNGSVSAVKRAASRIRRAAGVRPEDVVIGVDTEPGEIAQVDFGYAGRLFDEVTGRIRKAWIFVMVLAFSRHMFAKLVWDQKAPTWVQLHVEAFEWFGGVPRTIVPDNLKAAVIRAAFGVTDRDNLALNRTYVAAARYHGFKVDPTPPGSPQKKGKAESGVKYVTHNYLAAGGFSAMSPANGELPDWLRKTAGMRIHGTTGRRPLEMFAEEAPALLPLPSTRYDIVIWKEATVHRDQNVEFDRRLYMAPWQLLGQKVWVKADSKTVIILHKDARVATHSRLGKGRRSVIEALQPEYRRDLAHRSTQYWIDRGSMLGDPVRAYVEEVFDSDDVLSKLRDVQAIVTYLEQFPVQRAIAACRRASFFGTHSYGGLKRILVNGLDFEPIWSDEEVVGRIANPRFARSPSDLVLAATLEATQ